MFTTEFEVVMVLVSFLIGTFWGHTVFAWIAGWFSKEAAVVEAKLQPSGPSGTAAPAVTAPVGATGAH